MRYNTGTKRLKWWFSNVRYGYGIDFSRLRAFISPIYFYTQTDYHRGQRVRKGANFSVKIFFFTFRNSWQRQTFPVDDSDQEALVGSMYDWIVSTTYRKGWQGHLKIKPLDYVDRKLTIQFCTVCSVSTVRYLLITKSLHVSTVPCGTFQLRSTFHRQYSGSAKFWPGSDFPFDVYQDPDSASESWPSW